MDFRNVLLANVLSTIVLIGWGTFFEAPIVEQQTTKNQIANMCSILRECMEEGAWGLSTGLDYPPGAYADTEELINLSKEAYKLDGFYHTHTRAKLITDKNILAPWDEAIEIGKKSGIPVHLTHYKQRDPGIGSYNDYLGLVENAREDGMDVTFDCYTYPYSGTTITILLPDWSKDGGPEALMNHLKSSISRKKMCFFNKISKKFPGISKWKFPGNF